MQTNFRWLILSALIIGLDQYTKIWVEARLPHYGSEPLLPFLNLVHLQNTGAAFSMIFLLLCIAFVIVMMRLFRVKLSDIAK